MHDFIGLRQRLIDLKEAVERSKDCLEDSVIKSKQEQTVIHRKLLLQYRITEFNVSLNSLLSFHLILKWLNQKMTLIDDTIRISFSSSLFIRKYRLSEVIPSSLNSIVSDKDLNGDLIQVWFKAFPKRILESLCLIIKKDIRKLQTRKTILSFNPISIRTPDKRQIKAQSQYKNTQIKGFNIKSESIIENDQDNLLNNNDTSFFTQKEDFTFFTHQSKKHKQGTSATCIYSRRMSAYA